MSRNIVFLARSSDEEIIQLKKFIYNLHQIEENDKDTEQEGVYHRERREAIDRGVT